MFCLPGSPFCVGPCIWAVPVLFPPVPQGHSGRGVNVSEFPLKLLASKRPRRSSVGACELLSQNERAAGAAWLYGRVCSHKAGLGEVTGILHSTQMTRVPPSEQPPRQFTSPWRFLQGLLGNFLGAFHQLVVTCAQRFLALVFGVAKLMGPDGAAC